MGKEKREREAKSLLVKMVEHMKDISEQIVYLVEGSRHALTVCFVIAKEMGLSMDEIAEKAKLIEEEIISEVEKGDPDNER